jgi:hypothetical protein
VNESVWLGVDARFGRHLNLASAFIPEGLLQQVNDGRHLQAYLLHIRQGEVKQLLRVHYSSSYHDYKKTNLPHRPLSAQT